MPVNNEASERLSRKSSHAYKPREGVEINRASTLHIAAQSKPSSVKGEKWKGLPPAIDPGT